MPTNINRKVSDVEVAIRESNLFTQVEPEWLAASQQRVTYVNKSRGVVAVIEHSSPPHTARIFHDRGGITYASTGWYCVEELENWWFRVMRSDRAWKQYIDQTENYDITEVLDYV